MAYVIDPDLLDKMNLRKASDPEATGPYEIVIPDRTNIATDTVGKYAKQLPDRLALVFEEADLTVRTWTFAELDRVAVNIKPAGPCVVRPLDCPISTRNRETAFFVLPFAGSFLSIPHLLLLRP